MYTYRLAKVADSELLVQLRIDFLDELWGKQSGEVEMNLRRSLAAYFEGAIPAGSYLSWLAFDGEIVAGVGAMTIWTKPGNYKCPNGKVGYVMNMYTSPDYRKRGICSELLRRITATAKEMEISILEMHATADGEPVYRKYQFVEPKSPYLELPL